MEKCYNSSRYDGFPAGLRVLVVDDDPTWIKILEKMLKKCSYEVTTCGLATTALSLLREKKDRFDIVISDVNMPDIDGFKLLELLGLEMDLPVIMMSVDGETSRVMKGVQHGACDYLLKPVRMKELRNIWQHVLRKKIHEVKDVESQDSNDGISTIIRNGSDEFDEGHILVEDYQNSAMKRKEMVIEEPEDHEIGDPSSTKKARVVWSVDLHQKFVKAVNQIGFDKVGPKKILDLMKVPGLTRENIASHLQKYRLYLTRLQKQDEEKSSFITTQPDIGSKDQSGNFGLQSLIPMNKDNPENIFGTSSNDVFAQHGVLKTHQEHLKSTVSLLPVTDAKTSLPINNVSQIGDLSFGSMLSDISSQINPWGSDEIPSMQLIPNQTSNNGSFLLHEESCSKPLGVHGFQTHSPPVSQRSCSDTIRSTPQIKLEFFGSGELINTSPVLDPQECNKFPDKLWALPDESILCSPVNGFPLCSLQGLGYSENLYPNDAEIFDYDIQSLLFDGLEYNRDYTSDSTENYSLINKGLFII